MHPALNLLYKFSHFSTFKSHFLWVGVYGAVVVAQEATFRTKIFFAEFDSGPSEASRKHSLFGAYENFLVKFYYCQKVKIEKCYRVRTAGRQNYRFYRDLKWNTR